jgi:hypothetical protein
MLRRYAGHSAADHTVFGGGLKYEGSRELRDTMRRSPIGDTVGWVRDFGALTLPILESTDATAAIVA